MSTTKLSRPDGTVVAFQCDACQRIFANEGGYDCCHCWTCRKEQVCGIGSCADCCAKDKAERIAELAKREADLFEKAEKLTEAEYEATGNTVVFSDVGSGDMNGEGYFSSIEVVREHIDPEKLPLFVWGTSQTRFSLDAAGIVESACEQDDVAEGTLENITGIDELQKLLDTWIEDQGNDRITYHEDNMVVVLLNK